MNSSEENVRPVTVVFTWDVTPGREAEFETWAHGVNDTAAGFPGHRGATWLRAEGSRHRYYTVLNFIDEEHLDTWLSSTERDDWLERLDGIAKEHRHGTTGLETWFSLPGDAVPPPARTKMVLVTLLAVYPISLVFQGLVAPLTQSWPLPLRTALFPLIVVPTLTYAFMPGLSRMLRGWLYPAHRTHRPAQRADRQRSSDEEEAAQGVSDRSRS